MVKKLLIIFLLSLVFAIPAFGDQELDANADSKIDLPLLPTVDEDNMASDSASLLPTQQSVKAYADTLIAALQADDLVTLSGVAIGSTHLATFTGTTIADNQTIKAALQALETALETKQAGDADLTTWAGITPGANVGTALAIAVGSAGAIVVNGGVLGTPSSGNLANCTFPTLNQNTTGTAAGLAAQYIDWNSGSGGSSIANKPTIPTASSLSVDDIITLSGVVEGSTHLSTFTGSTIPDNQTIKAALQALETFVEGLGGGHAAVTLAASATTGGLSLVTQEIGFQAAATAANGYLTSTDWNTFDGKMDNPMTTAGDIIYGGASGAPTRLAGAISGGLIQQSVIEGMATTGTASPGFTAYDSDSPGADKTAGFIGWQYIDGADGSENTDWLLQIMQAGVLTTILAFDESDDQFETTKPINSSGGFVGALTGNADTATGAASQVITDNAIATVDQVGGAAASDFAKFTANGLEGRSYAETRQDLGIDTAANLETSLSLGAYASDILGAADAAALTTLLSAASDTVSGRVELATIAETNTGTDTGRGVTPDGLAGSTFGTKNVILKLFTISDTVTTGDGKNCFTVPVELNGMDLVSVGLHNYTASTSGVVTVQIRNQTDTQDMLSTALTTDQDEKDSSTAATPAVINTLYDDVVTGDEICGDVDGAGTGAAGAELRFGFRLP